MISPVDSSLQPLNNWGFSFLCDVMVTILMEKTKKWQPCLWTQTFLGNMNSFFIPFSTSQNQFGCWLSDWRSSNAVAFSTISILHTWYWTNGLISWSNGSVRLGCSTLSIYFLVVLGLGHSRWDLDLFLTLSAEAIDLVPRRRSG